jgi:hypothetical protein
MRKKDKEENVESEEAISFTCAWCDDDILDDVELFTVGATSKPDIDLEEAEGKAIPLLLEKAQKTVLAIVPTGDSRAAQDGIDLLFTLCSLSCAQALTNALTNEMNLVEDASVL